MVLGSKDKNNKEPTIFENYSAGLQTNRDAWVYNFSKERLSENMK